jgi:hypothetical protein
LQKAQFLAKERERFTLSYNLKFNRSIIRLKNNKITVGGRISARRKPYRNDTRKPSNKARSKRICKHKAIGSIRKQATDKKLLNVEVID